MKKKFYAIKKGFKCGVIVKSWSECESLVNGYKSAVFKGFPDHESAKKWLGKPEPVEQKQIIQKDGTIFLPATNKKNKYGYYKERYYTVKGQLLAHHGTTIGCNCDVNNLYSGFEPPWDLLPINEALDLQLLSSSPL